MKAYRKRAKGSWTAGKSNKGDGAERQYAKKEIADTIKGSEGKMRGKNKTNRKKAKNKKASLEARINWYERTIAMWEKSGHSDSFVSYLRDQLRKAKQAFQEKFGK